MLTNQYPPATRGKIVVWGFLVARPFGGMTWQVLQYLAGFRRLGFDVWYVEDSSVPPLSPTTWWATSQIQGNLEFTQRYMESIGLGDRWVYRPDCKTNECHGALDLAGLAQLYREADVVFNLCGSHRLRADHDEIRSLVYVETDPVVVQIAVAEGKESTIKMLERYDHLFSYGENFGAADCLVPIEKFTWHPTRPPVCVDWWKADPPAEGAALTTIANAGDVGNETVWKGETYHWRKDYELRKFRDLPRQSPLPLELSLVGLDKAEQEEMREIGWRIKSARVLSEPMAYQQYILGSLGEWTVAKDQNIRLRSGWFSDRSACYLAAGRPVITQDTAFGNILPTGKGLFAFRTQDEALAAIQDIAGDYEAQSQAASDIANDYFAAEKVVGGMASKVGLL